ncbi:conserved hypothetical protein [Coccidioides posadasii str. Silveira]|uniref:C2H2-type domain-containing protein n=1 Tax=Coccidioides posadasii (strain RMSCC 757 / Silveira) TaxID=443226 RepID=E9CU08_COCPS|nr:conserved hypothetical protein [Coccidioides posadasii str. Silveira]
MGKHSYYYLFGDPETKCDSHTITFIDSSISQEHIRRYDCDAYYGFRCGLLKLQKARSNICCDQFKTVDGLRQPCHEEHFECEFCLKRCENKHALNQHLVLEHWSCRWCAEFFATSDDLDKHKSIQHYKCHLCNEYLATESDLREHKEEFHHLCDYCTWCFHSSHRLVQHKIISHNWCLHCYRYFETPNNLRMHKQTHRAKQLACYACKKRKFAFFSAMLIHMEAGTHCLAGVDEGHVNRLAFTSWAHPCYTTPWYEPRPFCCPHCDKTFPKLSSLYQHAETVRGCDMHLKGKYSLGSLRRYIKNSFKSRYPVRYY